MKAKIPRNKPSKLLVVALVASLAAHIAMIAVLQAQPEREEPMKVTYDYLSSAVWEVFGPTPMIRIIEVYWPSVGDGEVPRCADVEQALDRLDLRRESGGWCDTSAIARGGAGGSWAAVTSDY